MLSLLELVAQNQPHFQTHKALLVLGLQNDFVDADGKLPINSRSTFLERLHALIPAFREQSSNVIWVKTIYEADRLACDPATGEGDAVVVGALADGDESTDDDLDLRNLPPVLSKSTKHRNRALGLFKRVSARRRSIQGVHPEPEPAEPSASAEDDEELFLRQSARAGPACQINTNGAEFVPEIKSKINKTDTVVHTTHYSAFQGTSLLLILRARLVTELYICGCLSNISVLATVVDAARHGIKLNVVSDCLGYRKRSRHKLALRRMEDFFDANIVTSDEILNPKPKEEDEEEEGPNSAQSGSSQEVALQGLVDRVRLADPNTSSGATRERSEPHSNTLNGHPRKPASHTAAAESSATADAKTSDEQFTDILVKGARVPDAEHQVPKSDVKNNLVKTKVRMRSRTDKSKKEESRKSKVESKQGADASPLRAGAIERPEPIKSNKGIDRHTSTSKADGSDKLSDSPTKSHSLKPSVSQSTLSNPTGEGREKSTTSRVRLALSRSTKPDATKETPSRTHSPAISTASLPSTTPNQGLEKTGSAKMAKNSKLQSLATLPTLGPDDKIAEGDSRILYDFFPPNFHHPTDRSKPLKDLIFTQLYNEVRWQKMMHQQGEVPRLVCCQGEYGADGSSPVYRHPVDQTLPVLHFSPKVQIIRKQAEKLVGHPLNHVLIQLYRSGNDYISEHSDKTLDIVKGSSIVNVSFGAQRTMRLRKKKASRAPITSDSSEAPDTSSTDSTQRETQRVTMPHNSMFVLGLLSNEKWLHGIMADKRLPSERSAAEKAFSGIRISLTFRHIGTYIDARSSLIWGQGATSKEQREAGDVINDDPEETTRMVQAFSRENHDADFDWKAHYGEGFDVLHLSTPPPDLPILFATNNKIDTSAIQIFLTEAKIPYALHPPPHEAPEYELDRQIHFRDNDISHTEVSIHVPVIAYLDRYYPLDTDARSNPCTSASYEIFIQISALIKYWLNRHVPTYKEDFEAQLEVLEEKQGFGGPFVGGRRFSSGDCQMWPAIDEIVGEWEEWDEERFPRLTEYWRMVWKKKRSIREVRGELGERGLRLLKGGEEGREQL